MINAYTGVVYSEAETGNLVVSSEPTMWTNDLLEVDVLTGKVSVDGREGVELVLEQVLVFGVEEAVCQYSIIIPTSKDIHSDELSTVLCNPCPLSDDLGRPYHLVEDLLVDGSEGSGTRSLLLVGGSRVSLGFGEDTSLGEEDDVFVGKLLLELSGEPVWLKECV